MNPILSFRQMKLISLLQTDKMILALRVFMPRPYQQVKESVMT